jgi:drug/metabolite transporter (DMT)-like permease
MQKPPPAPAHAASRPFLAIGLMCLAWALFACLDATNKYLGTMTSMPMAQVVWMRYVVQLLGIVAVLGLVAVPALARTSRLWAQIGRSCLQLVSALAAFLALRHLQLDQTTTISFLTPLTVALLAGPLLGEWIGWRRGIAIGIGFCGALVALRPGFASVQPAMLWAFLSMASFALFGIITRYLAAFDRSEVTLFYTLLAGAVLMAPFAIADWIWPTTPLAWALLISTGVYGGLGHYAFIVAYRYAAASTLAPLPYVSLLTHTAAGFLVFGQLPDHWTLAGAAIVILTGLYLLHREHVTARAAAVAMTTEATGQR